MTTLLSGGAEVLLTVGFQCGMGDNGGETCSCLGSTLSCPFTAAGGSWKRTWGEVGRGCWPGAIIKKNTGNYAMVTN